LVSVPSIIHGAWLPQRAALAAADFFTSYGNTHGAADGGAVHQGPTPFVGPTSDWRINF